MMINSAALDTDELTDVTGGMGSGNSKEQYMRMECPFCHDIFQANVSLSSLKCPSCHKIITIKG